MDEKRLSEIEARANAATPGPWSRSDGTGMIASVDSFVAKGTWPGTGDFIAHAREDVPALVAEVRRLRALLPATPAPAEGE